MTKSIIIYNTKSGNTKLLAETIKTQLENLGSDVEIYRDKEFNKINAILDYDIIAVGSCIHMMGFAFTLRRKIKPLMKMDLNGKKLISFATSRDSKQWLGACNKFQKKLSSTGIKKLVYIGGVKKPPETIDELIKTNLTDLSKEKSENITW